MWQQFEKELDNIKEHLQMKKKLEEFERKSEVELLENQLGLQLCRRH